MIVEKSNLEKGKKDGKDERKEYISGLGKHERFKMKFKGWECRGVTNFKRCNGWVEGNRE